MKKYIIISIIAVIGIFIFWFISMQGEQNIKLTNGNEALSIGTKVGMIAPSFRITTINGNVVDSNDLTGKIIIITSSAAWCSTCVMEAQQFSLVYQKYKDESLAFITVDIDPRDRKEFIEQFKKDNNTPWDYADAQGGVDISRKYKLDRFEITYIIDKDGIIRFRDNIITNSDKLDTEIQKLL